MRDAVPGPPRVSTKTRSNMLKSCMKRIMITMIAVRLMDGRVILKNMRQPGGAVDDRRLDHVLRDRQQPGVQHDGEKRRPLPDIGQGDRGQRRVGAAQQALQRHREAHRVSGAR